METTIASSVRVIDTDTHVTEPLDLWTTRISSKWGDDIPHVAYDDRFEEDRWIVGGEWLTPVGYFTSANWFDPELAHPPSLELADRGSYDPVERLKRMDEYGIYAQLLYPNLMSVFLPSFSDLDAELALECVRAYNDFQVDFAGEDPERLLPLTVPPFWDIDATVAEMQRCRDRGHRGLLWAGKFEQIGLPHFVDPYWDRVYATAQDLELSVNFHVGFSSRKRLTDKSSVDQATQRDPMGTMEMEADLAFASKHKRHLRTAGKSAGAMGQRGLGMAIPNAETIAHIVSSDLCDRFPRLNFVSVESGFGYVPYLLDSLDWHWHNYGGDPNAILPSEHFARQVYGTFWFETTTLPLLESYPDNFMFETDFPHPTSLGPGATSPHADIPSRHIEKAFAGLSDETVRKVLHDTAARIYHVDDNPRRDLAAESNI